MAVKSKMQPKETWFALGISLIVVVISSFLGYYSLLPKNKVETPKPIINEEPKTIEYQTNMVMVGDALIHSSVYNDAARLANYKGYDFKPQITLIKEYVSNYDIAYYNQETILGGTKLGLDDYPTFNSPQEVGDAMIDAGFNLVSLATNHTMDSGSKAVLASRNYWNKQSEELNIHAVGSYSSVEEKKSLETKILESNGITYAMLNYTYGTNGMPIPNGKDYMVNLWPTDTDNINNPEKDSKYQKYKETVLNDINAIRDQVDVLMVAMHWGVEYTHTPTKYEKDMAKFLADNDVDIVIGTHPHVIQPVEYIDDTIIFYSLGNFISAQYQNQGTCTNYKCMIGLMSSLTITKRITGEEVEITIDNIENNLIYTYYKNWRNFKVIPFSDPQIKKYLSNYQKVYNTYSKIIESSDERITTVALATE